MTAFDEGFAEGVALYAGWGERALSFLGDAVPVRQEDGHTALSGADLADRRRGMRAGLKSAHEAAGAR